MIKGYFFNAKEVGGTYDRTYTADDFCKYLDLIVGDGVFMDKPTALQIYTQYGVTGLFVYVGAGQMWIKGRKLVNDADITIPVPTADTVKDNYYGVVAYVDYTEREVNIELKAYGDKKPEPTDLIRTNTRYEMLLAWFVVPKQATEIRPAYITDTRQDTQYCGTSTVVTNTDKLVSGTNSLILENADLTIKDADNDVVTPISDTVNGANNVQSKTYSNQYGSVSVKWVKIGKSVTYSMELTVGATAITNSVGNIGLPDMPQIEKPFINLSVSTSGASLANINQYASFTSYQSGTEWKPQVNFYGRYNASTTYEIMGAYLCQ